MELALIGIGVINLKEEQAMPMSKEAVRDKMKEKDVMVLDVLPESDYRKLHIVGSESLPLGLNSNDFVESVEKKYGKDKFFITYCAGLTCQAGPQAAMALQKKGFKANDYPGGIQEWSESGLPVEGTEAKNEAVAATAVSKLRVLKPIRL
jgi:rhodanese-related sulfurtransferase